MSDRVKDTTKSGGGSLSDLHPNWQYLITMVANLKYGKIEELTFENGVPVNCKLAVQNVNIGAEVKKDKETAG